MSARSATRYVFDQPKFSSGSSTYSPTSRDEFVGIVTQLPLAPLQAFDLIFAFDEIVALGYRESVNIAQIRTYTDMDSHEEKVFQMVQKVWQK